jgi:hypothetical protein
VEPSFVYLLPTRSFFDCLPKCCQLALLQALVGRRLDGLGDRSTRFPIRTHSRECDCRTKAGPAASFNNRYIFDELDANKVSNLLDDGVSILIRKGSGEMRDPRKPNCEVDVRKAELITCVECADKSMNRQRTQKVIKGGFVQIKGSVSISGGPTWYGKGCKMTKMERTACLLKRSRKRLKSGRT